jgi:hypothetical protein
MMGLEPTTFCMASASDVRSRSRLFAQTGLLAGCGVRKPSAYREKSSICRQDVDFGTSQARDRALRHERVLLRRQIARPEPKPEDQVFLAAATVMW